MGRFLEVAFSGMDRFVISIIAGGVLVLVAGVLSKATDRKSREDDLER